MLTREINFSTNGYTFIFTEEVYITRAPLE